VRLPSLGGRRFILTIGCGVACSVLLYEGKMSDIVFRDIIIATVGFYIAGNGAQKHAEIKAGVRKEGEGALSNS
jgi:hypothetical protein